MDTPAMAEATGVLLSVPDADDGARRIFAYAMPIVRVTPTEELMAAAQRSAFDPDIFAVHPPFFVQTIISNGSLDSYGTRMHESTLRNFAADAAAGVSVQNSHNTRQWGIGRSLTGLYVPEEGDTIGRVESEFYTVAGLRLSDVSTDDFIVGIRTGLLHDISVGFYGGTMACSMCGRAFWDWDCSHFPGVSYPKLDAKGNEVGSEVAFFWIKDARLSEYSVVYDGACQGAQVTGIGGKAQREADAGRLRPETARMLESRYQIRIAGADQSWAGATLLTTKNERTEQPAAIEPAEEERTMPPEANGTVELNDEQRAQMQLGIDLSALVTARALTRDGETPIATVTRLAEEAASLRALADDGRAYRSDLVTAALAEGVRAHGETFAAETYRGVLEKAEIEVIKRMRDDWKTAGDKRFPGGRATVEGDETEQKPTAAGRRGVPDAAFAG